MLSHFLKSRSRATVCVVGPPSAASLRAIKSIWSHGHTVFPVLPSRARILSHLIAESRADAIVATGNTELAETVRIASRCMGIPVLDTGSASEINPMASIGNMVLEARIPGTIVPVAARIAQSGMEKQIEHNRRALNGFPDSVLVHSHNWVLDSLTVESPQFFSGSKPVTPKSIIVDPSLLDDVVAAKNDGRLSTEELDSVVVDWPFSDDFALDRAELEEKIALLEPKNVLLRYTVPQVGVVSKLTRFDETNPFSEPLDGSFKLTVREDGILCVDHSEDVEYVGRGSGGKRVEIPLNSIPSAQTSPGRKSKKREMRPEWRVQKVPIAVYHKKRGFKGQIYYTTKHKGWTLYKSRY